MMQYRRQMQRSAAVSVIVILVACATPEQQAEQRAIQQEAAARYAANIPTCSSDKECQVKWSAARRWVLDHCAYKLQHITGDFMETFSSGDMADTRMWCRVTKSATSETAYRIELENGVNNPFATGGMADLRWDFNHYVTAAWNTPAG
jgi:hypothetical protein